MDKSDAIEQSDGPMEFVRGTDIRPEFDTTVSLAINDRARTDRDNQSPINVQAYQNAGAYGRQGQIEATVSHWLQVVKWYKRDWGARVQTYKLSVR